MPDPADREGTARAAHGPAFIDLAAAGRLVSSGSVLGVGGSLFTRIPLALVQSAITAGARDLTYVCWGGGLPLELLLQAEAIRKAVFCFSSLDLFGLAPRFRAALEGATIEVDEMNALAMVQAFEAAAQRLPSMPLQQPLGSDILERTELAQVTRDPLRGTEVVSAAALPLDVLLVHAQRADEDGNLELAGSLAMDPLMIGASRIVVASVEEIVPRRTLQQAGRGTIIPRQLVDAIVESPFGAYPTSCLPYYTSDYAELADVLAAERLALPPPREPRGATLRRQAHAGVHAGGALPARPRVAGSARGAATPAECMAWTLAREYRDESVCSAGAVSPLAVTSYLLAKRTHAPGLTLITTGGGYVDVAWRPMLLGAGEALDFGSALSHATGDGTYHVFYQPGLITHETIAAAQIDRSGRVNNIEVTSPSGRAIRLPGQGGMADVANMHRNFLLYVPRHSRLALVDAVQITSASRELVTDAERIAAGLLPGSVKLVTNLGVFELDHETRQLELTGLQPGATLEAVRAETGFELIVSERCVSLAPPTADELDVLRREVDPIGLCRLEFVPAATRAELLAEVIAGEQAWADELVALVADRAS
ncbi:MAG TPA: CoA-transferase [Gaiellales bacterium]